MTWYTLIQNKLRDNIRKQPMSHDLITMPSSACDMASYVLLSLLNLSLSKTPKSLTKIPSFDATS